MENPEKLATQGTQTQDEDKHTKNITQHALKTNTRKQTQTAPELDIICLLNLTIVLFSTNCIHQMNVFFNKNNFYVLILIWYLIKTMQSRQTK